MPFLVLHVLLLDSKSTKITRDSIFLSRNIFYPDLDKSVRLLTKPNITFYMYFVTKNMGVSNIFFMLCTLYIL